MRKHSFVHTRKNRAAFPVTISTKLTNTQQHYVQISYAESN
jgi:hypothetical protein